MLSDNNHTTKLMKSKSIQHSVQNEIDRISQKKRKDMTSQERMRLLQLKLYLKAKQDESYRFYILYDKIFLGYILEQAYIMCRANGGSPGVDGKTFKDIGEYGVRKFLDELGEDLRTRRYRPEPVKRVWIEKDGGGKRPLGIPTIRDRVAQQACKLIIEPIFEADFDELSFGFRPKRSAADAVRRIKENLKSGKHDVYDADLSKYFDTIPHDKLEIALRERITDPRVIQLIKLWLKAPVVEEDGKYTGGKRNKKGTPQGGVISPLLANIYMNLLDRIVNKVGGYFSQRGIEMIRYADDFILMSRSMSQESLDRLHKYLSRMGLIINEEKSKKVQAREESFDFLGFTFRYDRSIFGKGRRFWNVFPMAKSEKKIRQRINSKLKRIGHMPAEFIPAHLNPIIAGWMNYYKIDGVSYTQVSFKRLDEYLRTRLYRFYQRKSQRRSKLYGQRAYDLLTQKHGLIIPYKTSGIRPVNALRRK